MAEVTLIVRPLQGLATIIHHEEIVGYVDVVLERPVPPIRPGPIVWSTTVARGG